MDTLPLPTREDLAKVFTDPGTLLVVEQLLQQLARVIPGEFTALQDLTFVVTTADADVAPNAHVIQSGDNIGVAVTAGFVTIKATPSGTSGQIQYNNGGSFGAFTLGGDATLNPASGTLTLASTGIAPGTYGDATHIPQISFDAKGRATLATQIAISAGGTASISGTPPGSPTSGALWWVNDTASASAGRLKLWAPAGVAGSSGEWLDATPVQPGPAAWGTPAAWVTATAYTANPPASVVTQGGSTYVCLISHTSGVFATDLAAGKWILVAAQGSSGSSGPPGPAGLLPGGRLTLTSNTPVMTGDATAQTSVYYTPYQSGYLPIYSGSAWSTFAFSQLTLSLDATNHLSGKLYDVFVWNNSGTVSIGTGPAWSTLSGRGSGAGTTEIVQTNGVWTNANSITLKNGAGSGTTGIAANTATYVGSFYATANGQTGMAFHPAAANGGSNTILGLYNAYNRVRTSGWSFDNTSWTYTTNAARAAHGSNSNRVSWVDGLQQSTVDAHLKMNFLTSGAGFNMQWAMVVDSTSTISGGYAQASALAAYTPEFETMAHNSTPPLLGFHFFQATESNNGGGSYTMNHSGSFPVWIEMEM